jgi:glyoxylase-like metal-dependent hydrolase (beta-lactamase superfamily II)
MTLPVAVTTKPGDALTRRADSKAWTTKDGGDPALCRGRHPARPGFPVKHLQLDPTIRNQTGIGPGYRFARMDVAEIDAGLWRWTAYHEEWKETVGSVYCETGDGVVVIDPLVPRDDEDRFWRALDRDVRRVGKQVHVLVTVFWHVRSTAALVDRYSARVWAPSTCRAAVERRSGVVTDVFRPGEGSLPGGVESFRTARRTEVVFWIPPHRALVPGDVLLGDDAGGVRMCPESWLPEKTGHRELAESLQPLLDLPVRRILVSHGEPVLENGRAKLAQALQRP